MIIEMNDYLLKIQDYANLKKYVYDLTRAQLYYDSLGIFDFL